MTISSDRPLNTPTREPGFLQAAAAATRGSHDAASLRIAETFTSRQGEGQWTGAESHFIRVSGCNLRCWFCDTPYASWAPEGPWRTIEDLVADAVAAGVPDVVITGGEPMLFSPTIDLCDRLRRHGLRVTIETAGTVDQALQCDLVSISPKLRGSAPAAAEHPRWHERHHQRRLDLHVMRRVIGRGLQHQIKFVVDSPADFEEIRRVVEQLGVRSDRVWVMPQGVTVAALDEAAVWLGPWVAECGYRYCDRMHIRWYGNRRGT